MGVFFRGMFYSALFSIILILFILALVYLICKTFQYTELIKVIRQISILNYCWIFFHLYIFKLYASIHSINYYIILVLILIHMKLVFEKRKHKLSKIIFIVLSIIIILTLMDICYFLGNIIYNGIIEPFFTIIILSFINILLNYVMIKSSNISSKLKKVSAIVILIYNVITFIFIFWFLMTYGINEMGMYSLFKNMI